LILHLYQGLTDGDAPPAPMAVVAAREVREILWLTAIDQSVPVFSTREEALDSIRVAAATAIRPRTTAERIPLQASTDSSTDR
jgi:hypothetical protein